MRIFTPRLIILGVTLALLTTSLAFHCSAASARAMSTMTLRIVPEADMTITPMALETQPGTGENIQWIKVDLAIRLNPGTTASLWLHGAPESSEGKEENALSTNYFVGTSEGGVQDGTPGDASQAVFTAQRNGRYSFTIGVKLADNSETTAAVGKNLRLELKSSDHVLYLIRML